ncbi:MULTISPECIES: outer membrane protein transport protein [Aliivibrio]|uniref:Aromatic hydrocarbon degradation protein n=1 Tax=Aliivibrio finisterrensis TaxID=511998 RepID=A0A4V1Z8L5_9GAMM|nr:MULTISPECIES: outer membrane protein transport protein [Aliivibrio]MDD9179400.1 outer membrane protein transport protein [Aliivibrio sp. A6]RYU49964.1 aromatic hydrocarbon degradation protein [Aliivibrio finisterrensis]RYU50611.1 aromatic hydrocarbon degradation protein [Aliivibrio finisterrensis]RYU56672.1 aromatic hydrocarbon degradation protein [Aliivibrio finisterrensis]RYU62693.1 aromatic hydrocarbon degradation protein [Aliivibrio finisterrensis]
MNNNKNRLSLAIALGLLGSVTSTTSMAAGFQLAEYSATGLGRAYAGEAAMADGADAQWRNMAMLTYLEGTQISVGGIYVDPNVDVSGKINDTIPTSSKDFAHSAVIPNFYLSHRVNEKLALGVALGTNYGMETDLDDNFAASHFGNTASIITKELNLNIAYQVMPQLSVGGGVRYVMGEGHFGATAPKGAKLPGTNTPIPEGTTLKYMEGTDEALGWQVGTAWQINDTNRLGFTYKSEVKLDLEGHAKGIGFIPLSAVFPNLNLTKQGSMALAMPATAELASFHQLTDSVAIHASVNWTDWSSFEKLEADFHDGKAPTMVKEEHWEDNYRIALGGTYQLNQKITLRSGIAYDTSAVSDKNRTITIPETDRTWLSIGAGYEWSQNLSLDAGFTYIIAKDAPITESRGYESDNEAQAIGGSFNGETTGSVWLLGVQANYRF